MTSVVVDLVVAKQLVRLSAWTAEEHPSSRWRASALVRREDGQFALASDGAVIHGASAVEALGRLAAGVLAQLLPLEPPPSEPTAGAPASLPVPVSVGLDASLPAPVPISLSREERSAQLTRTIDQAIERLAQQLSEGHTEGFLETMAFYAKFWKYSLGNLLLIQSQRPEATQVAGVRRWNALGYSVRKGEKGIWIWAPITKCEPDPDTGELTEVVVGFRPAVVFDASHLAETAEKPLPQLFTALPDDVEEEYQRVVRRIEREGIVVEERPLPSGVQGMSLGGVILLRPGLDSRNRLFTLLHELAHELGHKEADQAKPQAVRELEAEASAFVVASVLGLEIPTSRDYLVSWHGTAAELKAAMQTIQRLVRRMLAIVEGEREAEPLAA